MDEEKATHEHTKIIITDLNKKVHEKINNITNFVVIAKNKNIPRRFKFFTYVLFLKKI